MNIGQSIGAKVIGNMFHDIRTDGIDATGGSDIEIAENTFKE
jgi:hypothetical protein